MLLPCTYSRKWWRPRCSPEARKVCVHLGVHRALYTCRGSTNTNDHMSTDLNTSRVAWCCTSYLQHSRIDFTCIKTFALTTIMRVMHLEYDSIYIRNHLPVVVFNHHRIRHCSGFITFKVDFAGDSIPNLALARTASHCPHRAWSRGAQTSYQPQSSGVSHAKYKDT